MADKTMKKASRGYVAHRDDFKVEVKYSKKAEEKDLIRFTMKGDKKSFEFSAWELADLIVPHFNREILAPILVENKQINMIEVTRTISGTLEKDMKKGDKLNLHYRHMVPIEFAYAEEAHNLCKVTGTNVEKVPLEEYERAEESVLKKIKEFSELQNKEFIDRMKKENEKKETKSNN